MVAIPVASIREGLTMQNEWFLDVLTDLKAFAEANELCAVAAKLTDLGEIARAEMAIEDPSSLDGWSGYEAGPVGRLH